MTSLSPPRGPRRWLRKAWRRNPARPKRSPNASVATSRSGEASRSRLASARSNTLTGGPRRASKLADALVTPQRKSALAIGSDGQKAQSPLWPEHALIGSHHVADALVDEFLQAFALPGFGRVDVALGIGRDAVHAIELAGLTTAIAECGHLLERLAHNDANPIVLAVRQEDKPLVRIS